MPRVADGKGMSIVPTTLVVIVFLLLVLVVGLVVLNHGTGIMKDGFDAIEALKSITDGIMPGSGESGDGSGDGSDCSQYGTEAECSQQDQCTWESSGLPTESDPGQCVAS